MLKTIDDYISGTVAMSLYDIILMNAFVQGSDHRQQVFDKFYGFVAVVA